jgi:hypothetical protein
MFAVNLKESGADNPSLAVNAPIVLLFAKGGLDLQGETSLYTGGLAFRFGFGDYAGHTLAMIAWHSVLHVTEAGDVAPASAPSRLRPRSSTTTSRALPGHAALHR